MSDGTDYGALVDAKLRAHRWILCADVAAAFTPYIPHFAEIGAPRPLLLAGSAGTGPQPEPELCEVVMLGTSADTMLGGIRAYHAALRNLPADVQATIDAWDPDHEALVMQTFLDTRYPVAGRSPWGSRPEAWLALEDKMIVDRLWDDAGVDRADSEIVPASPGALVQASRRLDRGSGLVWTADNREGWHGGAEYSRFVADPEAASSTIEFMQSHAHRVRVMPYLDGIPCAIHGIVFPNAVATFRPVEMVVFRDPTSDRFRYASCATSWDPPPARRDEMREMARRTGAHLRTTHGFRGAFTIDGVLTADGFMPTELNPRYGAGIGTVSRAADMPLLAISRMLIEGQDDGLDPAEIEHRTVEAADAARTLGGFTTTTTVRTEETEERRVRWDGTTVTEADDEDAANATLTRGPATHGTAVRFSLDAEVVPVGPPAAPIVAAAFALADRLWDLEIGDLTPAEPA